MSYDLFSDSAKDTALDAIGGTIMGSVETELLKQVFVAVGNNVSGGGITALTGDVTGGGSGSVIATIANDAVTFAKMQNISTSTVLGRSSSGTGNVEEIGTTTGGGADLDAGKIPILTAEGGLTLGNSSFSSSIGLLTSQVGLGDAITVGVETFGRGVYSQLNGTSSECFHAHVTDLATGSNSGLVADMGGGSGVNYVINAIVRPNGLLLYGVEKISAGVFNDRISMDAKGAMTFYATGSGISSGSDKTTLTYTTPSGTNTVTLPAATGTVALNDGSATVGAVMLGNGTGPMTEVLPSTSGNILTSNGTTWTSATPIVTSGTGSPEGVRTASVGSLYTRTDGGAGTTLYVKESGTGNTGWVAK